ncbi:MAG: ribbon-helix-helix protein, CopG family [Actinobacteria bacterium]|nr:ribbon-helix-helix protein, CopG family [Actinomycetota bacterium]
MRTTVDLDDDVLDAVRSLARSQGRSMGVVLSELARRGLAPDHELIEGPGGFPAFESPRDARPLTVEGVHAAMDDD